jgi:hypothetical protein
MKNLLLILALIIPITSIADSRSFDRTWLAMINKKKVSDNYSIWSEVQSRMDNDQFTNLQLLFRAGALRPLNEQNEVGFLYTYIQTGRVIEHRPTLQFNHIFFKEISSSFSLRNRIEFRKIENNDALSTRYRGAIRYQYQQLVIWEEPFINLTSETWTGKRVFERNRFFIGPSFKTNEMNFEVGYLNQYVPRKNRAVSEHILAVFMFY